MYPGTSLWNRQFRDIELEESCNACKKTYFKKKASFPAVFLNGDVEEFAVQATTVAYPPPGSTARIPTLSWEKKYIT